MTRIFITGDTHMPYDISKLNTKNFPVGKTLTKNDYVIILGDFGLIWNYTETGVCVKSNPKDNHWSKDEIYWKKWLEEKPWTTLFIDGNHENFDRLNTYPIIEWNGGKVQKISDSIIHLMRGEIYTINNKKFFVFGGARSTDRGEILGKEQAAHDIHKWWWPEELPTQYEIDNAINNLEKNDFKVDYILTHTLPNNLLMTLYFYDFDRLTSFLWNIYEMTTFSNWFCGHFHDDVIVNYKTQVLYNTVIELDEVYDENR